MSETPRPQLDHDDLSSLALEPADARQVTEQLPSLEGIVGCVTDETLLAAYASIYPDFQRLLDGVDLESDEAVYAALETFPSTLLAAFRAVTERRLAHCAKEQCYNCVLQLDGVLEAQVPSLSLFFDHLQLEPVGDRFLEIAHEARKKKELPFDERLAQATRQMLEGVAYQVSGGSTLLSTKESKSG